MTRAEFLWQQRWPALMAVVLTVVVWLVFQSFFPAWPLSVAETLVVLILTFIFSKGVLKLAAHFRGGSAP